MQTKGPATHVMGFRKWQELDRWLMKGEKGITILAPRMIRKTAEDSNGRSPRRTDSERTSGTPLPTTGTP